MGHKNYHTVIATNTFATVILPMAVPQPYTYYVPEELLDKIQFGIRVEVQFGKNKLYAALVIEIHQRTPKNYAPKPILSVIDERPIIHFEQLKLWQWIAAYYCCTLGEVMNASLPSAMKLSSNTRVLISPSFDENYEPLSDKEYLVAEALSIQEELSIEDIRKILNQKTVYPIINRLLDKRIIYLKEELQVIYKPKKVRCVRLSEPYFSQSDLLQNAFERLGTSNRQLEALMAYIQLSKKQDFITKQDIYKLAKVDSAVLKAIAKKEIFEFYEKEVSRLGNYEEELVESSQLTAQQEQALTELQKVLETKNVALLHGVTGSGKTRIYIELITKQIKKGAQVLYLLPEIALTTQIISRLQKVFGKEVAVYHSRLNHAERVEIWQKILDGIPLVLAVRSGLLLPFRNLKLIIVDEEHDTSFKQFDPAPRYNARDASIYLATLYNAKVVLGTATPSVESYHNVETEKYGLIEMPDRFGGLQLPEIVVVDLREELLKKSMHSHFSSILLNELKSALNKGEQAILFKNRRGYAPVIRCTTCKWTQQCIHCDVSLTYHKYTDNLHCHYCGYQSKPPSSCPACGNKQLNLVGYGTEKIEDELKILLPEAKIGRLDFDSVRTKNAHARIINDFEEKRVDILVGTQMVTKGLDFDNVSIVGILSADHLLQFPDFRAHERAFQLMTQVSGRCGRKHKRGKVIIQAFNTTHPVLLDVISAGYTSFFRREILERKSFFYPPFTRLIKITTKHKRPKILNEATKVFTQILKEKLGNRVIGPAVPAVPRIRGYYLLDILIKLERKAELLELAKKSIADAKHAMQNAEGFSSVRVNTDVDPY